MCNYKEIVTKGVIGKGKKLFTTENSVRVSNRPSTILGCWVINHNFRGEKQGDQITITGNYDVNIWYSYDNDTKTDVVKAVNHYQEIVRMRDRDVDSDNEDIIVRSLKQPTCSDITIDNNEIHYTIEKELGIEIVGDTKVKVAVEEEEEPWDVIEDTEYTEEVDKEIDNNVKEDYLKEQ